MRVFFDVSRQSYVSCLLDPRALLPASGLMAVAGFLVLFSSLRYARDV